jgi:hypothetical protein
LSGGDYNGTPKTLRLLIVNLHHSMEETCQKKKMKKAVVRAENAADANA